MRKIPLTLALVLTGVALAASPLGSRGRSLVITYRDGHTQAVSLERDTDMIQSLHFGEPPSVADSAGTIDLSGPWNLRFEDKTYSYFYVYDAVLTPVSAQTWRIERTLRDTNHSFHHTRIGQSDSDCHVKLEQEKIIITCDGVDPNPSGLGKYHAEYEGARESDGTIRTYGRASGRLNVSALFEMRRKRP